MLDRPVSASDVLADAALGAVAGAAATLAMGPLTEFLQKRQSPVATAQEKAVTVRQGDPPTVKTADQLAKAVGTRLPEHRKPLAGQVVHYGFGTFWGAALGALSAKLRPLPPGTGVALGVLLWLSMDEGALPAMGLSGRASEYPPETHARGLAGHLLYGVVLDRSLALMKAALGRSGR